MYEMKFCEGDDFIKFMKFIQLAILLIPMPFLFHYFETTQTIYGDALSFIGTFLYVIFAGLLLRRNNLYIIVLTSILTMLISVWLGTKFITPPNESWFNPFGMDFAIIFIGIIILIGVLIVRFVSRAILFNIKE